MDFVDNVKVALSDSGHIEGNTLTYGQTELLLLFGKVSGEGDLKDFVDIIFLGARRHTTQAGKTATGSFAHMEPGRMCECLKKCANA